MSRSWSSAHDWKSCKGQKPFESSNLSISAIAGKFVTELAGFLFLFSRVLCVPRRALPRQRETGSPTAGQAPTSPSPGANGEVVGNLAVDAPGSLRRGRTCHPDGQGNCFRQVQHKVRPAIKKIRTKGRFSLGLTPFLLARAKEMGCLAAGRNV